MRVMELVRVVRFGLLVLKAAALCAVLGLKSRDGAWGGGNPLATCLISLSWCRTALLAHAFVQAERKTL